MGTIRNLLILALLTGCEAPETKFHMWEWVTVIGGFYKTQQGIVVDTCGIGREAYMVRIGDPLYRYSPTYCIDADNLKATELTDGNG